MTPIGRKLSTIAITFDFPAVWLALVTMLESTFDIFTTHRLWYQRRSLVTLVVSGRIAVVELLQGRAGLQERSVSYQTKQEFE